MKDHPQLAAWKRIHRYMERRIRAINRQRDIEGMAYAVAYYKRHHAPDAPEPIQHRKEIA